MTKEYDDINSKYLSLYDENDKLQEYLQSLQYKLQNGTAGNLVSNFLTWC